jgi:hypothetical protein
MIRRLTLLAVAGPLLALPGGAVAAAKIRTESDPQVGHLGIDLQNVSTGQYHWDSLNYQLHACGHGKADPGQCRWQLYGRTGVNYERCPVHEKVETDGHTTFTNFHRPSPSATRRSASARAISPCIQVGARKNGRRSAGTCRSAKTPTCS